MFVLNACFSTYINVVLFKKKGFLAPLIMCFAGPTTYEGYSILEQYPEITS